MNRATAVTQKVDTVALKAQTVLSTSVNNKVEDFSHKRVELMLSSCYY